MDLGLVSGAGEDGGAAIGAEVAALIAAGFAVDGDGILREDCGSIEECAVMLAAVEAVAHTDPVGPPRRRDPHLAAKATAGDLLHETSPSWPGGKAYTAKAQSGHCCGEDLSGLSCQSQRAR